VGALSLFHVTQFFKTLKTTCAEQLSKAEKMRRIVMHAFRKLLKKFDIRPPDLLPAPA
jgi:hypothetical protein